MELGLIAEDAGYVEASVRNVWFNLGLGAGLATLVMYLFLRSGRATAVAVINSRFIGNSASQHAFRDPSRSTLVEQGRQGVPFVVRTGKRLPRRVTQIAVRFRRPPVSFFASAGRPGRSGGAS